MIKRIRVLITSNDSSFRSNLAKYLADQQDIQIISQTDSFQVPAIVQALQADVLLLDAQLVHSWGTELLLDVQVKNPAIKTLFSSHTFSDAFITEALQYGAKGFILKSCPLEAYAKAIRLIHSGELWITRRTLTHVIEGLLAKKESSQELPSNVENNLTTREKEIMAWISEKRDRFIFGVCCRNATFRSRVNCRCMLAPGRLHCLTGSGDWSGLSERPRASLKLTKN